LRFFVHKGAIVKSNTDADTGRSFFVMKQPQEKTEHIRFEDAYAKKVDVVLSTLKTTSGGLSTEEAHARLEQYGPNELASKDRNNPLLVYLRQFNSVLIYILFVAAGISYWFDHLLDMYVILGIILLNSIIGFTQEYRAFQAISALKKALVLKANVFRNGELTEVTADALVPGDIVSLEAGMLVPADVRIIDSTDFRTNESSLTGESLPVHKGVDVLKESTALADRTNMAWMGTVATKGSARAVVVLTGNDTAIGNVATLLEEVEESGDHFKIRARTLAIQMGTIGIITASIVFLVGYFVRDIAFDEIFLFTIAALVSGIPSGLPAILSIVLAVGAYRMSKRNALVRTLAATETLGVTTTIVTDKTGTLTQNVMMVEELVCDRGDTRVNVTGDGWRAVGEFTENEQPISVLERRSIAKLLHIAAKGSGASVSRLEETDEYRILGDPTEAALTVLAHKAGLEESVLFAHEHILRDIPFSSETKWHATLVELREHGEGYDNFHEVYVAGAPERVLDAATMHMVGNEVLQLTKADRERYTEEIERLSRKALRVLGLAYRTLPAGVTDIADNDVHSLVFVGVVGMKDPVRHDVPEALVSARRAGIRVIMATGDHKTTAYAIAKEIGLIGEHEGPMRDLVMTGVELEALSDAEFTKAVQRISVFARLEPKTKLRIARSLQASNQVVAMTGDGVNDALALKQADIGIAMGKVGTDVARQSSDIVLTDDNFATIIKAVEEGRTVFTNTRQSAAFLISTNFAEHATILSTMAMGLPLPLLPTQILWLNLVTDGTAGAPLALEPSHSEVLLEKPRKKKENILGLEIIPFFLTVVSVMVVGTVFIFHYFLPEGIDKARTGAFAVMAFTQFFNMLNVRSLRYSLFAIGLFSNKAAIIALGFAVPITLVALYTPFFQHIFRFETLSMVELLVIIAISSNVLWFGELYKAVRKKVLSR
jgi:P-type Ca2+ transporter type 2C